MPGEDNEYQRKLMDLIRKRDEIDEEISRNAEVLEREKNVGMDEPLTDREDFPRADINVPLVRQARHAIIRLRNDRKELMEQIEKAMEALHAEARSTGSSESRSDATNSPQLTERKPFAVIKHVEPDSPAFLAGFKSDDEVLEVGSVNHLNFSSLNDIKLVIDSSENSRVRVLLRRKEGANTRLVLAGLVPKKWKGSGLVGCAVLPLAKT
ncbi:unnamed protein product [Notodromas monacha]|uniref:26S proteasome non-ATPase regulatory subunit 9 n=1 Tax=Notodromas monacha TaxID=399045 RepID=A0A7R9BIP3_9CRUS|nr:unnamed protein product [Notodromas monacha]CAG0916252.1 unnamed protein product [Notodromas monacha]